MLSSFAFPSASNTSETYSNACHSAITSDISPTLTLALLQLFGAIVASASSKRIARPCLWLLEWNTLWIPVTFSFAVRFVRPWVHTSTHAAICILYINVCDGYRILNTRHTVPQFSHSNRHSPHWMGKSPWGGQVMRVRITGA